MYQITTTYHNMILLHIKNSFLLKEPQNVSTQPKFELFFLMCKLFNRNTCLSIQNFRVDGNLSKYWTHGCVTTKLASFFVCLCMISFHTTSRTATENFLVRENRPFWRWGIKNLAQSSLTTRNAQHMMKKIHHNSCDKYREWVREEAGKRNYWTFASDSIACLFSQTAIINLNFFIVQ
mgnify:CR=1 FL=1